MNNLAGKSVEKFVNFSILQPIFSGLSISELRTLHCNVRSRVVQSGEIIVHENSICGVNAFFMIFSGRAKVFSVEDDGEQIYAVLGKGDFFGEMSVLDQKPRSASVAAIDDCEVFVWDADSFLRMLQEYPSISIEFMRILSKRLRRANRRINNFSFMSARERLIVYLKEDLERRGEPRDDGSVLLPDFPSQSDLGSIVGSSRETVSRIFREFTHEGILKKIGYKKVLVLNEKLLQI